MKITRRIFAVLVAVLMIAAMVVPFAADTNPDGNNTLTVNGKDGFTATVYKIADFNTTDGTFSNAANNNVLAALKASNEALLLQYADALTAQELGNAVGFFTFTATNTSKDFTTLAKGAYYVQWTWDAEKVQNVTKVQNSVLVLPYYKNNTDKWIHTVTIENNKISTEPINYDKVFTGEASNVESVNAIIGETIAFTLSGSVPGSADKPATSLTFTDTMVGGGLVYDSGLTVKAGNGVLTAGTDYTVTPAGTAQDPIEKTFTISFSAAKITEFYSQGIKDIEISYTAKLTSESVVIGGNGNPNTLTYSYVTEDEVFSDDVTKYVKTYELKVKKVDANNTDTVLGGATFQLSKRDDSVVGTTEKYDAVDSKTTPSEGDDKGIVTFNVSEPGTYKVIETAAPADYSINTTEFIVTINEDGTVTGDNNYANGFLVVKDAKVVLPNTGGAGTLLFTIGGIALIAGAAVLFIIYKKKASSK